LRLYAGGGDAIGPEPMLRELDRVQQLGIDLLKIRARHHQADKSGLLARGMPQNEASQSRWT
jgi:hypothetical protein